MQEIVGNFATLTKIVLYHKELRGKQLLLTLTINFSQYKIHLLKSVSNGP